jgi:hypothetical protein
MRSVLGNGRTMTPNQLYTHVFRRLIGGWGEVWAFREVAEAGLPAAAPRIARQKQQTMRGIMQSPEWPGMLRSQQKFDELGGADGLVAQMTGMSLKSAQAAVDAASLVFAHSIVDAAAVGFLRVTAMASPKDWEPFLDNKRKWSVAEVREFGYQKLFRDTVMKELEQIERSTSLPQKGQLLRQLCRPEREWQLSLSYEEGEIIRIDRLRHDIIHGSALGNPIPKIENDLKFLEDTAWYFFVIVHKRYSAVVLDE